MEENDNLFFKILSELDKAEILQYLILIGGWCQKLYRLFFNNPVELSSLRTADIDFLIPLPVKINKTIDVPDIFKNLGFDEVFSGLGGYTKYVHPDLEIEFLISESGKGKNKPHLIKELNINAQGLRYLHILQKCTMSITINNIKVIVPKPTAFVLNKLITSTRRENSVKREKDLSTAIELGEYIIDNNKYKIEIKKLYDQLHPRIKKKIFDIIKIKSEKLCQIFK